MKHWITVVAAATAMLVPLAGAQAQPKGQRSTIVLVHGAFAESGSWNGVIELLRRDGYTVIAASNPLRGVASDAASVAGVVNAVKTPVVLVGHSYGGPVIGEAAAHASNVKALVYVAAFAADVGESAFALTGKFPGATLGAALAPPVILPDGTKDLYIEQDKFAKQFAADVPAAQAALMAATQRPVAEAALNEPALTASWKTIPSWFIYGSADLNIPPAAHAFMAKRAAARKTVVVPGASHVVMTSNPKAVAALIEAAATAQ
ncbi:MULTISPECIES: alpha/beta fold hydrolase [unclassified Sphingomonas]|uniref:alpha/beta fold hydrolase n=1 Tax=unclassified Sphingomonas TaxID=196159 RepID=UPI0006FCBD7D|nr:MULTISPECIES: alpha/beta hydrolase [unclassified Sphingomonas]KQS51524.1 alpha/beta hydrolase [Sphingomonas sp. Leaf198]